jgi:mono/diheme cytochrome c family protein
MGKFFAGMVIGVFCLLLAGFCYVRFGFVDPRADAPVEFIERAIAMPALDAAVGRRAPETKNPLQPTEANLTAGMNIYQSDCSSCHGDPVHPHAMLANALYPRPPQFVIDAPDMPSNENFYFIAHGVRWSGMPAWKQTLSSLQIWQITTFLNQMDKLPPPMEKEWRTEASGTAGDATVEPPDSAHRYAKPQLTEAGCDMRKNVQGKRILNAICRAG